MNSLLKVGKRVCMNIRANKNLTLALTRTHLRGGPVMLGVSQLNLNIKVNYE